MKENRIEKRPTQNESLKLLSEQYYREAQQLEIHIEKLKVQIKARPCSDELESLEKRLEVLRAERRDLLSVGLKLTKLAAPPAIHPSLARRERDAS